MLLRNVNTGGLMLYNIANNQITGSFFLGSVGLDWQYAGVAPIHGPGTSDLVLRNVDTGAFQVYNIANNQLTGSASLGAVGLDWQLGGFAANSPAASGAGVAVPLSQVAQLNYEYEEPILWRRNRDMVLTVRGDIVDHVQAPDVSKEVEPKLQSIKDALPYGYRIETGGSIEESVKANSALVAVFPVMAIAMLAILMIQLQSFSRLALKPSHHGKPWTSKDVSKLDTLAKRGAGGGYS
jgi:hypothetical protein